MFNKMCKYETDPTSIVKDTEQTRFCTQMDRRTDGQKDKVKPVYPPFNFVKVAGIISVVIQKIYISITSFVDILDTKLVITMPTNVFDFLSRKATSNILADVKK